MKRSYYILAVFGLLFIFSASSFSQQRTTRQRPSQGAVEDKSPTLTERARIKNEVNSQAPTHMAWLRELYRDIDLEKEANAPLLYPAEPIGERVNLFTLIFRLVLDGKVPAYNYMDNQEVFNDSQKADIAKKLESLRIFYTTQGSGESTKYIVEDMEVPSSEVTRYLAKESWFFDEATGSFNSMITALCPILVRMDYETGVINSEPFFWVVYEDIRPYISREMIMTSNYNNILTYTIDDFFTKRMYNGDIIKTVNLLNQSLAQQVSASLQNSSNFSESSDFSDSLSSSESANPLEAALKAARDSIEAQLKGFEEQLWIQPDTTMVAEEGKKEKKSSSKVEKPKETKVKESSSSSSAPTKSVRGRRTR